MAEKFTRRNFIRQCGFGTLLCASTVASPYHLFTRPAAAAGLKKGFISKKESPYYLPLDNQRVRCLLCPHGCEVAPGERGFCDVRENIGGRYFSMVYANPCAVHVDPIEKKPFFHLLPTTRSFSIATAGCNLGCKFCQNWEISQSRPEDTFNYDLPPAMVVRAAERYRCHTIASTYVEPTIFMEYMLEIGRLTKPSALLKVMHSNGYISSKPLSDLCNYLDAACIDLKGFSEAYYRDMTGGGLDTVLSTLKHLSSKKIHLEIVTLIIPGKNDDMKEIEAMCRWIRSELGPDTPLHFSRFYPRYKLKSIPPTPVSTLENARKTALHSGLFFVYIGNVAEHPGEHTYCPGCQKILIERVGYRVTVRQLREGRCSACGREIAGIWTV